MIINMTGGGGGAGATLVVTGVADSTCTVSKDTKTYTKTFGADSTATFKGLTTGTWTVTMTNSTQTAVRTIVITSDYALTIAYFSATINITYPANSTCVVADSSGITVATNTNTTDSTKTFVATVSATGTYTITATSADGTKTKSTSVTITTDGQSKSVTVAYELVLFDGSNGGDNTVLTGGWAITSTDDSSYSEVTNKHIYIQAGGRADVGSWYGGDTDAQTKNTIDTSGYSTAEVTVSNTSITASFSVGSASLSISDFSGTFTLDISKITKGKVKVSVNRPAETWASYHMTVTKIRIY